MATGYLFSDTCYPTLAAATSAHWSVTPTDITPGSTSYISDVSWSGSTWVIKKYTLASNGTLTLNSTTTAPTLAFETCDTMAKFSDGMALGWGVVAAMAAVWGIRFVGRALSR